MKKILVVDDEKEIRDLLQRALERNHFPTVVAGSGEEALTIAKAGNLGLILLDIALPGMDGYQICEALRNDSATAQLPVLFLTGKDFDPVAVAKRMEDLGVGGYLSKPSTIEELLVKVRELFAK